MKSIGIIGAENSHTVAIAKVLNIKKSVAGFSVDYVWGETEEFAKAAAEAGQISNIVDDPRDMLGKVDAIVVDHRHPKHHLAAARPFLKAGVPLFIDKPFCYRAAKGHAFLDQAEEAGTPVTSFSIMSLQQSFRRFTRKVGDLGSLKAAGSIGPCDLRSPYGGVFFYGIHQVDMALNAFGFDVEAVRLQRHGENGTGQLFYPSGLIVTMDFIKAGVSTFSLHAVGEDGRACADMRRDKDPHLGGVRIFTKMFKTGRVPMERERIMRPVEVLEALQASGRSGKVEKLA